MNKILNNISQQTLEHFVPAFANGDEYIFSRLQSFFDFSYQSLVTQIGENLEDYLHECPEVANYMEQFICCNAAKEAIPQLDLVLTDTGFGIVSNNMVAPASRDRVSALVENLRQRASMALDVVFQYLLKYTAWKNTEFAKRLVFSPIYLPTHFVGNMLWKGKKVYWDEFAELRPQLIKANEELKEVISSELFDAILDHERLGDAASAYMIVFSRSVQFLVSCLNTQNYAALKKNLLKTIEVMADELPEYKASSLYQSRHIQRYENKQSDGTFFFG